MFSLITTSWLYDVLLLIISFLIYGIYKMKKKYDYFKEKGMPYHDIGILNVINWKVLLLKETIEDYFDSIYKKVIGHKYVGIPGIMGKPVFLLLDPKLIEKILIKDFSYFHDRAPSDTIVINILEANLFNLSGQKWRTLRAKLSPTFTSGKLKWMFNQMSSCTDVLIESLNEKASGEDFLIREIISCYGFDIIASCAFGLDPQSQKNPNNEFRLQATKIFKPSIKVMITGVIRALFPKLSKILNISSVDSDITDFFFNLTKTTLENRKKSRTVRNDFLQLLLQLKEKGFVEYDATEALEVENPGSSSEKLEFTDEFLTAQLFIFFIAGFETVATLIKYSLYALSKNDQVQSNVRDEVKRIKQRYGEINYDCLKEMTYLESVMSETLRLYPPAAFLIRVCSKNYKLEDGNQIEKDSTLLIPIYSIHRDSRYFTTPNEFHPERFDDGGQLSIRQGHGVYLPFGDGPRVCIARRFALLEAKIALAKIVENFQIHESLKNIEPLKRDPKSFIFEPIGGLWLKMKKISPDVN
ncbi:hypothetical protein O3M35_007343 [Rhynocoris fuscipes]|uniref:Cytochrome P450 n=1 Tax=Rhynocoris fuscipes TaxID=488301 RepID=A0AAW1D937_9HEMI